MVTHKVVLTKDLKYVKDNQNIRIKKGSEILVDVDRGIALIGLDHIMIYPEEYKLLYLH